LAGLSAPFRRKALFMDVESIAPGQDLVPMLETRVAECDVLLALIARNHQVDGHRRSALGTL
jgi:hypothetical protein